MRTIIAMFLVIFLALLAQHWQVGVDADWHLTALLTLATITAFLQDLKELMK